MATIKDVAKRAQVSISTVSHVINHTKHVSEETVERVEQAIKDLNYKTNIFAKNLKSQQTKKIGVVLHDVCGMFFPYIIREISKIANQEGYTVALMDTKGSIEAERKALESLVENYVDGIILSSMVPTPEKESYAEELKKLLDSGTKKIPLVMLERDFSAYGIDSICTDLYSGGIMAMEHLMDLGCRNVAHIAAPEPHMGRYYAYQTVLEKYQIPYRPEYVEQGDYSHESGYVCTQKLLDKGIPLDAIFLANDQMAIGAIRALHEREIQIPEDIKVIGFDNVYICDALEPPLSSISMEKRALGQKSASLLLKRIRESGEHRTHREVVENTLMIRKSTMKEAKVEIKW